MVRTDVALLNPDQYDEWDTLINTHSQGTIFHYSDWLNISNKYQNSELQLFGFFCDGKLVGGCPFYIVTSHEIIKTYKTTSVFGPYGGLVFNLDEYNFSTRYTLMNTILRKLEKEVNAGHFGSVIISNSPGMNDVRYFTWNGWESSLLYTYYLDLPTYENPVFINNMEKKAADNRIVIEESNDLDAFYTLFRATWQRRGHRVPIDKTFIAEIFSAFEQKNRIKMLVGRDKTGDVAAANIILIHPSCIYAWISATDSELWKTGAHYAIYSHIIKTYKDLGYPYFDIMMANTKNLLPFAHCFNPRTVPFFRITKRGIGNSLLKELFIIKQNNSNEF